MMELIKCDRRQPTLITTNIILLTWPRVKVVELLVGLIAINFAPIIIHNQNKPLNGVSRNLQETTILGYGR
jgi:hypothetical protein